MNSTNAIERLRASAGVSGTELSLRKRVDSLAQARSAGKSKILLLDTSESMSERDNAGASRIDKLWNIVQQLRAEGLNFQIATFSSYCNWSDAITKPTPSGGTRLTRAFEFVRDNTKPDSLASITLVHDGKPFDPEEATELALAMGIPVNVLFVGDTSDTDSLNFAQSLAEITKGQFASSDINVSTQLALAAENSVRLMLTENAGANANNPIAL